MTQRSKTPCLLAAAIAMAAPSAYAGDYPFTQESNLDASDVAAVAKPQFADLDGDGDEDIVLVGSESLWWFENDGALGEDMVERSVDPVLLGVDEVAVHDFDGDGALDIVASGGGLRWYENVEDAAAFTAHVIEAEDVEGEVAAGDIDGDGDADVVLADYWAQELHWYANPGAGGGDWAAAQVIPSSITAVDALLAADVDGDGRADVIAGAEAEFTLLRFADGPWTEDPLDPGSGVVSLRAADIDGDGDLDVLCGQMRHAVLMRNVGDAVFGFEQLEDNGNLIIEYRLDAGDVDGDGDLDIVAVTHGGEAAIRWFPNEGDAFGARQTILDELYNSRGMDVADADCDGDADIVAHGDSGYWRVGTFINETNDPGPDACADDGGGEESGGEESGEPPGDDGDNGGDDTTGGEPPGDGSATTEDGDDEGTGAPQADPDQGGGGGGCSIHGRGRDGFAAFALVLGLGLVRRRRPINR